jgi:putative ABC transport system ATP-binding protein
MGAREVIISARQVKRSYRIGREEVWALRGVSLDIFRGEYLSIMGPSGSGKSTLFNMIGGLDLPTEGEVLVEGDNLGAMDQAQLAYIRNRKIGYIFQTFNLIPVLTALENVTLPLLLGGMSEEESAARGVEILGHVGLGARANHRPSQLSGGQQQRVAIARALANRPRILLADEPTGNLDLKTGEEIIGLLGKLQTENGVTVISATHDNKMLAASDRVVYLSDGQIAGLKGREELNIKAGKIRSAQA